MDFYWTTGLAHGAWWLLIFVAALVVAMVVPLGRRRSSDTGDAKAGEKS